MYQISSAYREKRHGLFTYYFLKGLQGEADRNQDGMVEVQELDAFVRSGVQTIARRLNVEQTPQLLPSSEILGDRAKDTTLRLHEGRMDRFSPRAGRLYTPMPGRLLALSARLTQFP